MKAFRWFPIVAVMAAIGLVERTAYAQVTGLGGEASMPHTIGAAAAPAAAPAATLPPVPAPAAAPGPASAAKAAVAGVAVVQGVQGSDSCPSACNACCAPCWHAFAEYLVLRPLNEGVEYAVPINGNIVAGQVPAQIGPTGVTDPQFQSGFRVGFERLLDQCSSISLTYTYYRNEADDGPVGANTPFVLQSMVFNPSTVDAADNVWGSGTARQITNFNLVDLDYHHNLWNCDCASVNYLVGTRYAQLGQQFEANFQSIISASTNTNIEFDGLGLRLGLDGERMIGGGFFFTAQANANFLGGQFTGSYLQSDSNNAVEATTYWHEARFVTILESEVSVGWQSCNGRVRASVGYLLSDWLNIVKPSDFISSVQANQYVGTNKIGDTSLVFDGLKARIEFAW